MSALGPLVREPPSEDAPCARGKADMSLVLARQLRDEIKFILRETKINFNSSTTLGNIQYHDKFKNLYAFI